MSLWSRFGNLFRRGRLNRDLDEEQQHHLESRIEQFIRQGMPPAAAEREALRRFGNRLLLREESGDVKVMPWLDDFFATSASAFAVCVAIAASRRPSRRSWPSALARA